MIELDERGQVRRLHIKQADRGLRYSGSVMVWSSAFSRFMHGHLQAERASGEATAREWHIGDVVQAAIDAGLHVDSVVPESGYIDVGSPEVPHKIYRGELRLP